MHPSRLALCQNYQPKNTLASSGQCRLSLLFLLSHMSLFSFLCLLLFFIKGYIYELMEPF